MAFGKMLSRRFSSKAEGFFRNQEISVLNELLTPSVARSGAVTKANLLVVSGPKNSGKGSIMREFVRRQKAGEYPGLSGVADLIKCESSSYGLTKMIRSTFPKPKIFLKKNQDSDSDAEPEVVKNTEDVLEALESFAVDTTSTTLFVNEADRMHTWTWPSRYYEREIDQLLHFFVRVTKDNIMNVVLLSSESFFDKYLQVYLGPLSLTHAETLYVGDLQESEARRLYETCLPKGFALDRLSDELWKDVYEHVGGRVGLLCQAAKGVENWDAVKNTLMSSIRLVVQKAWLKDARPCSGKDWTTDDWKTAMFAAVKYKESIFGEFTRHPSGTEWTKEDWKAAVSAMLKHKDGVMSYTELCSKLNSVAVVDGLIKSELLHIRNHTKWGSNDIEGFSPEDWPLVMPPTKLHLRAMQELVKSLN